MVVTGGMGEAALGECGLSHLAYDDVNKPGGTRCETGSDIGKQKLCSMVRGHVAFSGLLVRGLDSSQAGIVKVAHAARSITLVYMNSLLPRLNHLNAYKYS